MENELKQISEKIIASNNILVALNKNANVDELAAGIGLTMALDAAGKHATVIYSGRIPSVLEAIEPEKTLEKNTNSLRDFIIALKKEKADHLRYKVEGDYVRIFVAPYRTTLSQADLEFSHGEYNVDLVVGLNVANESELDPALEEYEKIKAKAELVNLTVVETQDFAQTVWTMTEASSVSQMVAMLLDATKEKLGNLEKEAATVLLLGVMGATDRFATVKTDAKTMRAAAILMEAGADQQLIVNSFKGTDGLRDKKEELEIQGEMKIERNESGEGLAEVEKIADQASDGEDLGSLGQDLQEEPEKEIGDIEHNPDAVKKEEVALAEKEEEVAEEMAEDNSDSLVSGDALKEKGAAGDVTDELKLMPEYLEEVRRKKEEAEQKKQEKEKQKEEGLSLAPLDSGVMGLPDKDYAKMMEEALAEAGSVGMPQVNTPSASQANISSQMSTPSVNVPQIELEQVIEETQAKTGSVGVLQTEPVNAMQIDSTNAPSAKMPEVSVPKIEEPKVALGTKTEGGLEMPPTMRAEGGLEMSPTMAEVVVPTPPPIDFDNPVLPPVVVPEAMKNNMGGLEKSAGMVENGKNNTQNGAVAPNNRVNSNLGVGGGYDGGNADDGVNNGSGGVNSGNNGGLAEPKPVDVGAFKIPGV